MSTHSYIVKGARDPAQIAKILNVPPDSLRGKGKHKLDSVHNLDLSRQLNKLHVLNLTQKQVDILAQRGISCSLNKHIRVPTVYQPQLVPNGKPLTGGMRQIFVELKGKAKGSMNIQSNGGFDPNNIVDGKTFTVPHNINNQKYSGILELRNKKGYTGAGVTVVVIDTGVDVRQHGGNLPKLQRFENVNIPGDETPSMGRDSGQHGTHVLGTIYAMATKADFSAIRFLEAEGGTDAAALAALKKAVSWYDSSLKNTNDLSSGKPMVINNSWGGSNANGCSDEITRYIASIRASGRAIVFTAAAGNETEREDTARVGDNIGSPGCSASVVTVGAMNLGELFKRNKPTERNNADDRIFGFSSYGDKLNIAGNGQTNSTIPGGGLATFAGTSMATPDLSGSYAILIGKIIQLRSLSAENRAKLPTPAELMRLVPPGTVAGVKDGWSMLDYFIYTTAHDNPNVPATDEGNGTARLDRAAKAMVEHYGLDFNEPRRPTIPARLKEASVF